VGDQVPGAREQDHQGREIGRFFLAVFFFLLNLLPSSFSAAARYYSSERRRNKGKHADGSPEWKMEKQSD
jgi:hypothetical protein